MRTLPQSGLGVPSNHPVLVDGLDSVGVELDALEEVLQEAADEHLFVRQRGPRWIARHRLEVTCAKINVLYIRADLSAPVSCRQRKRKQAKTVFV